MVADCLWSVVSEAVEAEVVMRAAGRGIWAEGGRWRRLVSVPGRLVDARGRNWDAMGRVFSCPARRARPQELNWLWLEMWLC